MENSKDSTVIIAITCGKGGCGKTTTSTTITSNLNNKLSGKNIVLESVDPNNSLNSLFEGKFSIKNKNGNELHYFNNVPKIELTKEEKEQALDYEARIRKINVGDFSEEEIEKIVNDEIISKRNKLFLMTEYKEFVESNFASVFDFDERSNLKFKNGENVDVIVHDFPANHDNSYKNCDIFNIVHLAGDIPCEREVEKTLRDQLIARKIFCRNLSAMAEVEAEVVHEQIMRKTRYNIIQNSNKNSGQTKKDLNRLNAIADKYRALYSKEIEMGLFEINVIPFVYIQGLSFFNEYGIDLFIDDELLEERKLELKKENLIQAHEYKYKSHIHNEKLNKALDAITKLI
ncbi:TPA: ArsA-related P-loop ATPase [Photobacterium damselae]